MAKQPKKTYSLDSFLEAFKDIGKNALKTAKDEVIVNPFTKPSNSTDKDNFQDIYKKEVELEEKYRKQVQWQKEIVQRQEQIIYQRQDREVKLQVQALQEEIKQLARASVQLSKEVEIASFSLPPQAGSYHINFFERLRNLIKELRNKIQESSYWLAEWNKKAQKRNYYWKQVKKSGSMFMLSSDRQVATQTG